MDSPTRRPRRLIAVGVAVLALGLSILWLSRRPMLPWIVDWRAGPHGIGDEMTAPVNLTLPYPGGTMTLEKMWYYENRPEMLRISGHFTGEDPRPRFHLRNRVREEKEGFESGSMAWFVGMGDQGRPGETPFLLENLAAPVAAEKLFVRIYFMDPATRKFGPILDFPFRNALYRKPEPWPAESLPATRVAGPLKIELQKMETGFVDRVGGFPNGGSRLILRVLENGAPVRHWRLAQSHFSTGTGLKMDGSGEWGTMQESERKSLATPEGIVEVRASTLWKCEGTWKTRLVFEREDPLPDSEIIEVKDIPVPELGKVEIGGRHWKFGETDIHFLGLAGGATDALMKHSGTPPPEVEACFQIFGGPPRRLLRVLSMTDESGQPVLDQLQRRWSDRGSGDPFAIPLLPRPARPKTVTIKFQIVVFDRQETEFLARPTFLSDRYVPPEK